MSKPRNRKEWRVLLDLLRLIRTATNEQREIMLRLWSQVYKSPVLFFDEFDVVGKERGDEHETGEIKRVVSSLLLQVDALPSHVVVVVATNHPELLDRAVWRRFQLRLHLPAPNLSQVEEWFRRLEEQLGTKLGSPPRILAQKLKGLNFSELEEFRMDVQRRYTLALPEADVRRIVDDCLKQWKQRFSLTPQPVVFRNGAAVSRFGTVDPENLNAQISHMSGDRRPTYPIHHVPL